MPCVIGLARKTKARLAHVPLCWFAHEAVETCSREQKYITLMYSPELEPALGFLKRTRCHHAKHAQIAVGFDSDGTSRGVASAPRRVRAASLQITARRRRAAAAPSAARL